MKQVLLQTVKTQMKCSIMLHFIRVYTVCKGKKHLQTKKIQYFLKIITWHPKICTMDYPKFIASNKKGESISLQWVKKGSRIVQFDQKLNCFLFHHTVCELKILITVSLISFVIIVPTTGWWSCCLWVCRTTEWWGHLLHELSDTTTLHDTRDTGGSTQCGWRKYRGGKVCRYFLTYNEK